MLYLFHGEDEFSREGAVAALKEAVGPRDLRDINTTELDGRATTPEEVMSLCSTVPFMTPRRLVIVRGLLSRFERAARSSAARGRESTPAASTWNSIAEYAAGMPETTDLALVDGRLSTANALLKKLQPLGTSRAFPVLRGDRLKAWIRERAGLKSARIEAQAVNTLADLIGGNLYVLDGELDKLALYAGDRPIGAADVEALVAYAQEASIFVAVDAVVEGRPEVALRTLRRLLESGNSPAYVMAMIARQVRLLLLAKDLKSRGAADADVGRKLRLSGYPLRKTLGQETMFTAEGLAEVHRMLVQTDLSAKTGEMDEEPALELLVTELAVSTPRARRR